MLTALGILSLLLHEGAHALVARHYGYKLETVNLQPYGAELSGDTVGMTPKEEIAIALAGPMASALTAVVSWTFFTVFPGCRFITYPLAEVNLGLAVFNLLPVYPMDGGRVTYALLCTILRPARALRIVSWMGLGIGLPLSVLCCIGLFFGMSLTSATVTVFMLSSAVCGLKGAPYAAIGAHAGKCVKKVLPVKTVAILDKEPLLSAIRAVDSRCYVVCYIVDASGKIRCVADEAKIRRWSLGYPTDVSLAQILNVKKSL